MPVIWIVIGFVLAVYFGDIWFKIGVMIFFFLATIFHYGYGELRERQELKKREDIEETEKAERASLICSKIDGLVGEGRYTDAKILCDANGLDLSYFIIEPKRRAILGATPFK